MNPYTPASTSFSAVILRAVVVCVALRCVSGVDSSGLPSASLHRGNYHQLMLPEVTGPESIAFDCYGQGPYVGVSDGRILKWQGGRGPGLGWTEFAVTTPNRNRKLCDGSVDPKKEPLCGRPLGLKFNDATCELFVADAYYGLLRVGPRGGIAQQLVVSAGGIPFTLTNALDVDPVSGVVYFTVSSVYYQRREYVHSIENGDRTGRVAKYDLRTGNVTILVSGLYFPNGLALSRDKSFLVVAETGKLQLIKIWLRGPRRNTVQIFSELERYPDNVKSNQKGEFWVALNSGRALDPDGEDRKESMSEDGIPWFTKDPVAVKFDSDGKVAAMVDGMNGKTLESVSEVEEYSGMLWIGSVTMPYVIRLRA
ncbi:hypothetical protein MLD38_004366 [Melastoma candidum]|uniref:Uncharacterized protein n=1 Tax=Melastoma candidum TaxID=119954 RepID=A0ACB9S9C3_9MYRT|nr:hypothetical protein MLD38_004366 [Melastoma candidum]